MRESLIAEIYCSIGNFSAHSRPEIGFVGGCFGVFPGFGRQGGREGSRREGAFGMRRTGSGRFAFFRRKGGVVTIGLAVHSQFVYKVFSEGSLGTEACPFPDRGAAVPPFPGACRLPCGIYTNCVYIFPKAGRCAGWLPFSDPGAGGACPVGTARAAWQRGKKPVGNGPTVGVRCGRERRKVL